ncbi:MULTISPECIES: NAD(P)-dependent alcohol dehydrogenase [Pseudomonas]|jgi:aryl-alcohol dehydrogenase|uniref:NAD(P)-dependent alcohol dehydrogenase n=1 Tax=Pseudomonas TaxID=286 RepID=UPI0009539988|nr:MULTISPECIES: NAD(P)-dependent alcohol dehydrogenase [Pseudomonas]WLG65427.1 NAD(P)-dependent alcohol dehydrogenase [Pseudomonas brassicacearum]SIS02629.1 aryl-alcohol dehydrogenase [Pseudomonas sp. A214]
MQIKAAVVRDTSAPFVVETLTLDEPRADEILVRIVGAGVCHTDMVVRDQGYPVPLPLVLGHEGSGVVERIGANVTTLQPGDHVVLSYANCGHCTNCLSGAPGYCESFYDQNFGGQRTDGSTPYKDAEGHAVCGCFFNQSSFGTHALVSERNAIKIPKDVPLELMGPLGCGIQTGAGAIMNALKPGVGSSIAVFGAGSVGLSAIMAAKAVGCTQIIAVDMNDARLELARELGATHVINPASTNTLDKIRDISGGGVQFSLECTSHPKVLRQAVDCLRIPGVCGLVGAAPLGTEASLDMNTVLFGRTLRGIIEGDSVPKVFIPQLIELWRAGRFPFDRLVKYYALEDINQAVADSESGVVLKPILKP